MGAVGFTLAAIPGESLASTWRGCGRGATTIPWSHAPARFGDGGAEASLHLGFCRGRQAPPGRRSLEAPATARALSERAGERTNPSVAGLARPQAVLCADAPLAWRSEGALMLRARIAGRWVAALCAT